ncbi:MAG: AAA family ATPase [Deltaproteobacteria bacterium]|nr:AAA family ATPase [Deltaproteobacteria bacterium]
MQRQAKIFKAMSQPEFYPHHVRAVQQRETHISKVFLTGDYAYKVKKPVSLGFLDFATLRNRRHFCLRELSLNRRLTSNVYLDVLPITWQDGKYYLAGPGSPIEYTLKMRQLSADRSMLRLLHKGKINTEALQALAGVLSRFHAQAPTGGHINTFGEWEAVWANCEENFQQTEGFVAKILPERTYQIIRAATRSFLRRWRDLFQNRVEMGRIRDCHGDLRTGHIYFVDGIQVIDCIEFNERFRYSDIASDLAFLAMDLDHEGYSDVSQNLLAAYVQHTKDQNVFVLLDFYKCYRAFVRVKVNCLRLHEGGLSTSEYDRILEDTYRYMELAYRYAVQFTRPTLWVMSGLPASGKSVIAEEIAKAFGIRVFRSDVIRKELFGVEPTAEVDVAFEEGIYSRTATSLTYGKLLLLTQEEIEKGCSVILDATYSSRRHRSEVLRLARDMDVNLIFVECVCHEDLIKERLRERETVPSISDARLPHIREIKTAFEPLDEVPDEMHIVVDTGKPLEENMGQILSQDYALESLQTTRALKANA